MFMPSLRAFAVALAAAIVPCSPSSASPDSAAPDMLSGGPAGTTAAGDAKAFSMPAPGLGADQRADFAAGRRLFRADWRPRAFTEASADLVGLGPLYNRRSCAGCHLRNGRGAPPDPTAQGPARGMILRLGVPGAGLPAPHPALGAQLQDQSVTAGGREGRIQLHYRERTGKFADGTAFALRAPVYGIRGWPGEHMPMLSPRLPPAIFGGGLLEAVAADAIHALADPLDEDGDGVSGRLALIDGAAGRTLGRFGWKATRASLRDQVIEAAAEDLGLASRARPSGPCTPMQIERIPACAQPIELDDRAIDQLVVYLRGLAAPARRNADAPAARRGEALFEHAGCAACHRPTLPTGDYPPIPGFGGQTIRPYTDLLLHDMGDGLADDMPDGAANGREWRTAPLWGIGLTATVGGDAVYLHDGRARSLIEAVLWHGGEAAKARDAVIGWTAEQRAALIAFLESL